MTGYTLSDKHLQCLREVVEATQGPSPDTALPWPVLDRLRTLIGCDIMSFDGVDYLAGYSYFSQWCQGEIRSYQEFEPDLSMKGDFWSLVRSGTPITPWIPERNEEAVVKPTDFMSVRHYRSLPVYVECFHQGGGTTYALFMLVPDGFGRQLRLLIWRQTGADFNERERFDLQLLMPHLEAAYRRAKAVRATTMLTGRQTALLQLVRDGATNRQIARRMGLSEGTVRTHLNNIYARLDARSRTEAVTRVFGQGERTPLAPSAH